MDPQPVAPAAAAILVNFHCHSLFSDGELTPEALANCAAAAGVRVAALTDHDTLEGLPRFQEALRRHGIAFVPGVEITTRRDGRELHLLAYGFDPGHAELIATLAALRHRRDREVHSITGSLRSLSAQRPAQGDALAAVSVAQEGKLDTAEAIALVHRAGGRVFLAHPLVYAATAELLEPLVAELKQAGLDGLEAIYAAHSPEEQAALLALAERHGLPVSAGSDFHAAAVRAPGSAVHAVEMPRPAWLRFRQAVLPSFQQGVEADSRRLAVTVPAHAFEQRPFVLRIFLPTLIAIALFMAAIWLVILPSFEQTLLERKREMIRELTNSAWSMLAAYERDERSGLMPRELAQKSAAARVEALRYGNESKDYFWIQDLQPRMVMHPYRRELNGQDLRGFKDPRGVAIFVEFAQLVATSGEGYVDYVWQWKDDPQRLRSKESFVKGFAPWGWVIGTGIYTEDVKAEIATLERHLIHTSVIISGAVILLLLFVLQQSLRAERGRQATLDSLRESTQRYHALVEATTEGTLLVLGARCHYANPTFLAMLGYGANHLEFLDLADLLPRQSGNEPIWNRLDPKGEGEGLADGEAVDGCLRHADGRLVEAVLALNPITLDGQSGFILLAKDLARHSAAQAQQGQGPVIQSLPLGVFRARAVRRGVFAELNQAGRELLQSLPLADKDHPALADLFAIPSEYADFVESLLSGTAAGVRTVLAESTATGPRFVALSARLVRDERQQPGFFDGSVQEVTAEHRREKEREALLEKLQSSLLFLLEPIAKLGQDAVICPLDASVEQVARQMSEHNASAALIAGPSKPKVAAVGGQMQGELDGRRTAESLQQEGQGIVSNSEAVVLGIVTDQDLRRRVLAVGASPETPVHSVMSAPLTKIADQALVYEALMRMEERRVHHLVVEGARGQAWRVLDHSALVQFQSYGPIVLAREIARAATPAEVARCCARLRPLVKTLMDISAKPRQVTTLLAASSDAAAERLIQLALADLGPPPAPFAFLAMGSQGRQEQTLMTDQDNGIVYAQAPDQDPALCQAYFLRLGQRVCDDLNAAGYAHCRGLVMASQPRWCRSLADWLAWLETAVRTPEAQEVIDVSVFCDFRVIWGDEQLAQTLRSALHAATSRHPAFFHQAARNALLFKPPFRLVGSIYLTGGAAEHPGEINLKDAMMPLVGFARLYAVRHQLAPVHTLDRIAAMAQRGLIPQASRDEIGVAYEFLLSLRVHKQFEAIEAGRQPLNTLRPGHLGPIQKELLKQAFAQIEAVQKRMNYDFLGGVS